MPNRGKSISAMRGTEMLFKCIDCKKLFSMEADSITSPKGDILHVWDIKTHERIEVFDCIHCHN
jgi:hypothetical protein